MKKKTYMTPITETIELNECQTLLAGSGVTADEINYGGVDTDGALDPAAPEFYQLLTIIQCNGKAIVTNQNLTGGAVSLCEVF